MNNQVASKDSKDSFVFTLAFALVIASYAFYFVKTSPIGELVGNITPLKSISEIPVSNINIDTTKKPISLNSNAHILSDIENQMDIHAIRQLSEAVYSQSSTATKINLGVTNTPTWIAYKAHIISKKVHKQRLYVEITHPQLQLAEFYLIRGDGELYKIEGNKQHPKNNIGHFNDVFPLPYIRDEEITIFLKIIAPNHITFDLLLWDQNSFSTKTAYENFLFGLFYGSLGLMAMYNIITYFQTRDQSYLYFVLYAVFLNCYQLTQLGHGQLLGFWSKQIFQLAMAPYYLWAACTAIVLFVRSFLQTNSNHKAIDFCLKVSLSIILLQVLVSTVTTAHTTFEWLAYFVACIFFFIFIVISGCYLLGNINAKFLWIGWILNMTGALVLALVYLGFLPVSQLLFHSPLITLSFGSAFFSFALSDRVKKNEKIMLQAKARAIDALSRFETTFNHAVEGIYTLSLDGNFINANPALVKMLNYESENALKSDSFNSSRIIYRNPESIYRILAKNGHFQEEIAIIRNNKPLWAIHSAKLSYKSDGTPDYIEGTLVDISDGKLKDLAQLKKEKEAIEKDEELHAAKAKSQFLANMSHELRTPLTAIIGYSEALSEENDPKNRKEYLDIIARSGNHLVELINDVLDLSKVEANEFNITPTEVNIHQMLNDIESYFKIKAKDQGLYFSIKYQWPLPYYIVADATRMKQILLNLCSNALKFTEQGGIDILVRWLAKEQLLSIEVQDTGMGLTPKQLGKLFQSYGQADASTARNFGGTGLGLVISKQFAEKMGGDIIVSSEPGVGTNFTVTLGMPNDKNISLAHNESELNNSYQDQSQFEHLSESISGSILLIDLDPDCQLIVSKLFEPTALSLDQANSFYLALKLLKENKYSAVLLDIDTSLNNQKGIEKIIEAAETSEIIALTADVIHGPEAAKENDISHVLEKPFSKADLYRTISKVLPDSNSNKSG